MKLALLAFLLLAGCHADLPPIRVLYPDPNPLSAADPLWSPQPHRDRPRALCVSHDHRKAWVMLAGVEDDPGTDVAVVALPAGTVQKRVHLAPSPWHCALDPSGRWLVVTLRYADHASIIDTATDREVARVAVPFYTETAVFRPDGKRVFLANRWKDSVLWWDMQLADAFDVTAKSYDAVPAEERMGTPTPENPGPMALSADGKRLFVGTVAGCEIAVLDTASGQLIDADSDPATTSRGAPKGMSYLNFRSPVGGLAVSGRFLFVADMGRGVGAQANTGLDIDEDGQPGDGTANLSFQDQQNEIGVIDTQTLQQVQRYTSDTLCCRDFRDVDPEHPQKGQMLPLADQWSPTAVAALPAKTQWTVAGALPEAMAAHDGVLWVAFAGSNEVQGFAIAADGALTPKQTAGGLYRTGYNPKAIAVAGATTLVTVDRLGEGLTLIDTGKPPGQGERKVIIGDVSKGAFPSTDAELGEGINEMTAPFTIDGDQTCVQCHRDNGAIARPFVMPLQSSRAWSLRNIMAQRGLYDTRPWFFESAMNEDNFFPVLNEFARRENFCCEELDLMVWGKYPQLAVCQKDPAAPGCNHVLHCTDDPPPECATRPYGSPQFLTRAAFIKNAAMQLFGRDKSFGDAVYKTDGNGVRHPVTLDFDGITKCLGLFMLRTPRLLPNPNRDLQLPSARRGKELYLDPGVGCNHCHPLPLTTTATLPVPFSPFNMPVRFPPVISPETRPDGSDAMLVNDAFIATFPLTVQTQAGLHVGATPLRGMWDRPQTRLFHDGRARSLTQALATPGHAALHAGEPGFNERKGSLDTHGGTSQLDKYQLQDLMQFVLTL